MNYRRLGKTGLTKDMLDLFRRRVYDIAAVTNKKITVKLNSEIIPVKNFQQYIKLIVDNGNAALTTFAGAGTTMGGTAGDVVIAVGVVTSQKQIDRINAENTIKLNKCSVRNLVLVLASSSSPLAGRWFNLPACLSRWSLPMSGAASSGEPTSRPLERL